MLTKVFWLKALERAVKTAAQAALLAAGSDLVDVTTLDWQQVGFFAIGGAVLSVLTSLASTPFGPGDDPSTV